MVNEEDEDIAQFFLSSQRFDQLTRLSIMKLTEL